jgi:hypothetical protein
MDPNAALPHLFDSNVFLGPIPLRHDDTPDDVPRLLAVMDGNGISRALVTHGLAKWQHPAIGNRLVIEETKGVDRLAPCWVVMPSIAGEMPPEREQVAQLLDSGARAARLCTGINRLTLEPWELDTLLEALAERRVPLFLDSNIRHWSEPRPWAFIEWACRTYPTLPLVLLREPPANFRTLFTLMERYPNLYLETSYMQGHDAIALIAGRWGAERLIFGTGLPVWDPGMAITGLTYASFSVEERDTVAAGSLQRLIDNCIV